jgi:hypothetical protein
MNSGGPGGVRPIHRIGPHYVNSYPNPLSHELLIVLVGLYCEARLTVFPL